MSVEAEIEAYIAAQPEPKRDELRDLHRRVLAIAPGASLWFLDGRDETGKIVSNPNIGYGTRTIHYANGKTRDFYRIGLSANTTGISVYVMGIEDRKYLSRTYADRLGKASVTGYCVKFKTLGDVDIRVLEEMIRYGFEV
ncbi:DUF1801 domain-containing protein [Sphingomonas sp.]|uniref:DUF1801 domain-containing protein n=1 Tax=Sphingomonas sp. TaxID=28214 RepID=UPI001B030FA2|nr:DUF1801 domain-containing protein [Sphingomonas sp.]MBO9714636.1 DUF1801 domain-containing protein [Sphingomonas sp.]